MIEKKLSTVNSSSGVIKKLSSENINRSKFTSQLKKMKTKRSQNSIKVVIKSETNNSQQNNTPQNSQQQDIDISNKKLLMQVLQAGTDREQEQEEQDNEYHNEDDQEYKEFDKKLDNDVNHHKYDQLFGKTRYASSTSYSNFFAKYRSYGETSRKGLLKEVTPSYAFIKACKDHMLVPNPIGLVKRKGEENRVGLKYAHFYYL